MMSTYPLERLLRFWGSIAVLIALVHSSATSLESAEPSPVTAIVFSPDGQQVLAATENKVSLYNWPNLSRVTGQHDVSFAKIHDMQFSPDQQWLAISGGNPGEEGIVTIASWPDFQFVTQQTLHQDSVYSISWMSDSQHLLSAGLDGQVIMSDRGREHLLRNFLGHSKGVTSSCLLPQQNLLVTGGIDQSLRVWDLATGTLLRSLNNHTRGINDIQASPNSAGLPLVASVANDRTVRFWQPSIGRMVRFVKLDTIPLAVAWHPQKLVVAVTTATGKVIAIDAETAAIREEITIREETKTGLQWQYALTIDPTGRWIVVATQPGLLRLSFPESE